MNQDPEAVVSTMPPKQPQLGSLAIQAPSLTPKTVHVSASTCQNLSLFKDLLKEYRKLDDSINMRLNRTTAQFRDRDRSGLSGKGDVEDQACTYIWRELAANWKRRTEIIDYCVGVVDQSMEEKRGSLDAVQLEPSARRSLEGSLYADEVKACNLHLLSVAEFLSSSPSATKSTMN
ncbi:hypothetical protein A0H81_09881 [Grifola frondosa]|uniref:Caffeine-induced death protein 2 n=1 Tax=Grifola frondosa TaxID=5627 RepID=A0A1C7M0C5_GRIFR|nr:hypothetical protein A0H81_09881 [Grifola frondosa]